MAAYKDEAKESVQWEITAGNRTGTVGIRKAAAE